MKNNAMKIRMIVLSGSLILASSTCLAQTTAQTPDGIRAKIQEIEKVELQSKSATVQQIYKKTLLRLYQQYADALQQDISDLQKLATAVGNANAESQKEIAAQLHTLISERDVTREKIKTLAEENRDGSTETSNNARGD